HQRNLSKFEFFANERLEKMATKTSLSRNSKRGERPVFSGIRKPLAPPGHPMSHAKPEEKARPAGRKAKHKRKPEQAEERDED
ncbi:MAG: hypothetical protein ACRD6N_10160, partial [Pyrinomonadaceae bacterium]